MIAVVWANSAENIAHTPDLHAIMNERMQNPEGQATSART
jgi:hypothetical protein